MTQMLTAAVRYAELGFVVHPCRPGTKLPLLSEWQKKASCDHGIVFSCWSQHPDANIGAIPGRSGFIVIDVDGAEGVQAAELLGIMDAPTLICRTGRVDGGHHRYYRRPARLHIGNGSLGIKLDIRCDAGYVMLPPSIHPSGQKYRWEGKLTDVAALPQTALEELDRRAVQAEAAAILPPGFRIQLPDDFDKRARALIATVGHKGEGDRNKAAHYLACFLGNDMAGLDDVVWSYLVDWNSGNAPPMTTRELRSAFKSALKSAKRPKGCANVLERQRSVARAGSFTA